VAAKRFYRHAFCGQPMALNHSWQSPFQIKTILRMTPLHWSHC